MTHYIATCSSYPQGNQNHIDLAQAIGGELCPWQTLKPKKNDLILPLATWDYMQHSAQFIQWIKHCIAQQATLINPAPTLLWNINKKYLAELYQKNLPITPSIVLEKDKQKNWHEQIKNSNWQNPVIKPLIGQSGNHVARLAQSQIKNYPNGALLQQYIESPQGEICLIYLNGEYSHAIHRKTNNKEWRANSTYGVKILETEAKKEWLKIAESALKILTPCPLYARIDLLIPEDSPALINEIELIEPALYLKPTHIEHLANLILNHPQKSPTSIR